MRAMNRTEQYLHERASAIGDANPNPFMYRTALADFMREVAEAAAVLVNENAASGARVNFSNHFHARLAALEQGLTSAIRLSPVRDGARSARMLLDAELEAAKAASRAAFRLVAPPGTAPAPPSDEPAPAEEPAPVDTPAPAAEPLPTVMLAHWQIRDSRNRCKLGQLAVANALGVGQTTISRWENPTSQKPTEEQCVALRRLFNLPERGYPYD